MAETQFTEAEAKKITGSINPLAWIQKTYGIFMTFNMMGNLVKGQKAKSKQREANKGKVPTQDQAILKLTTDEKALAKQAEGLEKSIAHLRTLEKKGPLDKSQELALEADKAQLRAVQAEQQAVKNNLAEVTEMDTTQWADKIKNDPEWCNAMATKMKDPTQKLTNGYMNEVARANELLADKKSIESKLNDPKSTLTPDEKAKLIESKTDIDAELRIRQEQIEGYEKYFKETYGDFKLNPETGQMEHVSNTGMEYGENRTPFYKHPVMQDSMAIVDPKATKVRNELENLNNERKELNIENLDNINKELDVLKAKELDLTPEKYARYKDLTKLEKLANEGKATLSAQDKVDLFDLRAEIKQGKEIIGFNGEPVKYISDDEKARIDKLEKQKADIESDLKKDGIDPEAIKSPIVSDITFDAIDQNLIMAMANGVAVSDLAKMSGAELEASFRAGDEMFKKMNPEMQADFWKKGYAEATKELQKAAQSPEAAKKLFDDIAKVKEKMKAQGIPQESQVLKDYFNCEDQGFKLMSPEKQAIERQNRAEIKKQIDAFQEGPKELEKMLKEFEQEHNIDARLSREDYIKQQVELADPDAGMSNKDLQDVQKKAGAEWDKSRQDWQKKLEESKDRLGPEHQLSKSLDQEALHAGNTAVQQASMGDLVGAKDYAGMAKELGNRYSSCKMLEKDGKVSIRLTMKETLPNMKEIEQEANSFLKAFNADPANKGKSIEDLFIAGKDNAGAMKLFKVVMPKAVPTAPVQGAPVPPPM